MDQSRVIVTSPQGDFVCELPPDLVFERKRTEELNGEHSLSITTAVVLTKGQRVLTCDDTNTWREYVVTGEDAEHAGGRRAIGTYYCTWSLQADLSGVTCTAMPGTHTPVSASAALDALLGNTARWTRGTVTQTSTGGASMWRKSAWEALGILTKVWGGEVRASITVSGSAVTSRKVNLLAHEGAETVTRRFDYSRDLAGIRRTVSEDPVFARIIPLGASEETETGGNGRKITIESVNGGIEWLENPDAALAYRLPDGNGGWEYPTAYIENGDCETPSDLKAWGESVLPEWTTPKVSYEADVVQLARAGMDVQGIAIGDEVHVVDKAFGGEGIRIQGRVIRLVTDELQPSHVEVTLGNLSDGLQDVFSALDASLSRTREVVQAINGGTMSTAEYLERLVARINGEINATGGYSYLVPGQGFVTYDAAVSDPAVGAEATKAVEIRGGTIRIADSKTAQGAWEWDTLLISGLIASQFLTANNLITGTISDASGRNYWNLDTGELSMQIDVPVPAISVGATNLLDDTDAPSLTKVAASYDRMWGGTASAATHAFIACSDPPISGIDNMVRFTVTTVSSGNSNVVYYNGAYVPVVAGEDYTMSAYMRIVSGSGNARFHTYNGSSYTSKTVTLSGSGWHQVSWTFKTADNATQLRFHFGILCDKVGVVEMCGCKLERGNVATDWAPSAADIAAGAEISAADAAASAVSSFDQSLTQAEVFNRLTNNRQNQGIYISGGDLYINASMIATGTLAAARIASNSITADKIDASQLISPKMGVSASEYAQAGNFTWGNDTYSGIKFFANGGSTATIILGVHDNGIHGGSAGTQFVLGVGVDNGYFPLYWSGNAGGAGGNQALLRALPTKDSQGNYISPTLRLMPSGIIGEYNNRYIQICSFE